MNTLQFLGRLHPLLVHLPVALLLLLAFLEMLARFSRLKHANANSGLILAITVPSAIAAAVCGWLLSQAGGYADGLLQLHKWTGIGTAMFSLAVAAFYWLSSTESRRTRFLSAAYGWSLGVAVLLLLVTSHFGGSLTHGSDYLVRYAPNPLRAWFLTAAPTQPAKSPTSVDFTQLPVFTAVVKPVLDQNCVSCHGPEKAKGGLRLDSLEALAKGSEAGPALVAGKPGESPLITRLRLPVSHDDHMPPEGKPQPTTAEIDLLDWWVGGGAENKKVSELQPTTKIAGLLAARFGAPAPPSPGHPNASPKPLEQILPLASQLAQDLGVVIEPLSAGAPWLQCNASPAGTNFGDAELARLGALAPNLYLLDLAGTGVTDSGLSAVTSMQNLKRLHLERTGIGDAGLLPVSELRSLEYLNLYGTRVTDTGLEHLRELPRLKHLYLWQTQVTPAAAAAFAESKTDKEQLQRWQAELEQLQAKLRDARMVVEIGETTTSKSPASPTNQVCPVSGKPVDPLKTVDYQGTTVAFCCDDCKAQFKKDPAPFLARLGLKPQMPERTAAKAP